MHAESNIIMIAWTPALSVGIAEIDAQHKTFIDAITDIKSAIETSAGPEVVGAVLMKLYGYAHFHFAVEEKYFVVFNFPGAPSHVAEHRAFTDRVTDFRRRHEMKHDVKAEVAVFMFEWLVNHIEHTYRQYIGCFKEHGLH